MVDCVYTGKKATGESFTRILHGIFNVNTSSLEKYMCNTHENNISHEIHIKNFMCISLFLNVLFKNLHVCKVHLWHFAHEGGDNLIETLIFDSQTTEGTGH